MLNIILVIIGILLIGWIIKIIKGSIKIIIIAVVVFVILRLMGIY